jgi:hypothetical protein
MNYRSEVRKAEATTALTNGGADNDEEKVVEINDFLKTRVDPTKLNIRMFQEKIQKFQNKYGLSLVEGHTAN